MIFNELARGGRRRLMMAVSGKRAPYPDPWEDDGKVWCYYDITDTSAATKLLYSANAFNGMEVDGAAVTLAASYLFAMPGEHLVKFSLNDGYIESGAWRSIGAVLKRVYLPDTVTGLANYTFYNCTSLTIVRLSPNITSIGQNCCYGAPIRGSLNLTKLTSLGGSNALRGTAFTSIMSLGTVTSIPNSAFRQCVSLKYVELPATLSSIAGYGFYNAPIEMLVCQAVTPPTIGSASFSGNKFVSIKVPAESVETYKTASGWSSYASKIQAIEE